MVVEKLPSIGGGSTDDAAAVMVIEVPPCRDGGGREGAVAMVVEEQPCGDEGGRGRGDVAGMVTKEVLWASGRDIADIAVVVAEGESNLL